VSASSGPRSKALDRPTGWRRSARRSGYDGSIDLGLATDVGAELIPIEAALEFEPVGVWTGDGLGDDGLRELAGEEGFEPSIS